MALGAALWVADLATGRHVQSALSGAAGRLAAWYENERLPAVLCTPGKKRVYTDLAGIDFNVPECWRHEVAGLLDKEVHHFYDPDARAGIVSVSVETISTPEDREAIQKEFKTLAGMPEAEVVEPKTVPTESPSTAAQNPSRRNAADSLAERIAPAHPAADSQKTSGRGETPFRWVETSAVLGVGNAGLLGPGGSSVADRPSSSGQPVAVLNWFLVTNDLAVRVQYAVREDWSTDSVVGGEIERVRDLVESIRPTH